MFGNHGVLVPTIAAVMQYHSFSKLHLPEKRVRDEAYFAYPEVELGDELESCGEALPRHFPRWSRGNGHLKFESSSQQLIIKEHLRVLYYLES